VVKVEAFLSLESTVADAVFEAWRAEAEEKARQVADLLAEGKFKQASDAADSISTRGVVDAIRNRLEELAVSAMLLGGARLTEVEQTAIVQGGVSVSEVVDNAVRQFDELLEDLSDGLRDRLDRLLDAEEQRLSKDDDGEVLQKQADEVLVEKINRVVLGGGRSVTEIGANLFTSRLVTFGFLAEAQQLQITTYQVSEILDDRICPVCETMHGKTFEVSKEFSRIDGALRTQDPQELRSVAPWPSQKPEAVAVLRSKTPQQLQDENLGSPPYHPNCRGVLVEAGSVTEVVPVQQAPDTQQVEAPVVEQADFKEFVGTKGYKEFVEKATIARDLTSTERNMVEFYQGDGYLALNARLRGQTLPPTIIAEVSEDRLDFLGFERVVDSLDSVVRVSAIQRDVVVYRGVRKAKDTFGVDDLSFLEGSAVRDPGFMSVTTDRDVMKSFVENPLEDVVLRIKLKRGTRAIPIGKSEVGGSSFESELLLARRTKLRLTKVTQETINGVRVVEAELIE